MKKNDFEKIIKMIKPSFINIEINKVWYKAYFYVISFNSKGNNYKLYLDLVQDCAFIKDLKAEKEIGNIDVTNKRFLKFLQSA